MNTPRYLPAFAAFNAILSIAFGAFAAHAINDPQAKAWVTTGVTFQLPHVAAVFGLIAWQNTRAIRAGAWAVSFGSFSFAAALYALALGAPRGVAAFAPIGGALMLLGWLWLAITLLARSKAAKD